MGFYRCRASGGSAVSCMIEKHGCNLKSVSAILGPTRSPEFNIKTYGFG